MSDQNIFAYHNFILNGDFTSRLDHWNPSSGQLVTHKKGLWQGEEIGYLDAVNEGTASQTIDLADFPRPALGKAQYKLQFYHETKSATSGTMRINLGRGGEFNLPLVPTLGTRPEPMAESNAPLLDLNLTVYPYCLELDEAETSVTFTVISPRNDRPGLPGVRLALVRVELLLEPLALAGIMIDGEIHALSENLHLCFGADHEVAFQVAADNAWLNTEAGLIINNSEVDPDNLLTAQPRWGQEHPIGNPWTISCAGNVEDRTFEHQLAVRSQYTADPYLITATSGHFRLDVVPVKEAAYYPVIDLAQDVELRMRVVSHYTLEPLANREVTWVLKGANPGDDLELSRQYSDEKGEVSLTWTPQVEGDWRIEASVDSYYKKDDAKYAFHVRVLKADPWLTAEFSLDGTSSVWAWGAEQAYPCRGATHDVGVAFAADHVLADSELSLYLTGDDSPGGLGVIFTPDLIESNPVVDGGLVWRMACENRRDSVFLFNVRCSKLLHRSPAQSVSLAHNALEVAQDRTPTRYPTVGGPDLVLAVQIRSTVASVGSVSGIDVLWSNGDQSQTLQTGEDGWCEYRFSPLQEGVFPVNAKVVSRYDRTEPDHDFEITVLEEDAWANLVTVTLDGRKEERVGLLCFREVDAVELKIVPDDRFLNDEVWLEVTGEDGSDLDFTFVPPLGSRQTLIEEGATWMVRSTSAISARFQLLVHHDDMTPYELQGRLLSKTLEDEGTFTFDGEERPFDGMFYPCLGAEHLLRFIPKSNGLLNGLDVAAKWSSNNSLNATLSPVEARALPSNGLEWSLDALDSTQGGPLGVSLELAQARFEFPALPMTLGHNRLIIADSRGPTFDSFVGEPVSLQIKAHSYYTDRFLQGMEASFLRDGIVHNVSTQSSGWAQFYHTAEQPGPVKIIASLHSPYDEPNPPPPVVFDFNVLSATAKQSPSPQLPSPGLGEPSENLQAPEAVRLDVEIGEVREATFDPVVGEVVQLSLKVRSSSNKRAASGVAVTFMTDDEEKWEVVTDGKGWAHLGYDARHARDVTVIATLQGVSGESKAPAHTFNFKVLAASVWDDANIQLDTAQPVVWGSQAQFPRTGAAHTITLSATGSSSHLLGRDICLGLRGHSSVSELGLRTIDPPLGVARQLTGAGLRWACIGNIGGAYQLQLEASRILKQSPLNVMSMGEVPLPAAGEGNPENPVGD